MQPFEIIPVETRVAACNGGGGALGHPLVYLNLGPSNRVECPYCSRVYVLETPAAHASVATPARAT